MDDRIRRNWWPSLLRRGANVVQTAPHTRTRQGSPSRYTARMPKRSTKVPPLPRKSAVPRKGTSLRLPVDLLARLDAYAARHGGRRTDAIVHLLRWALEQAGG